MSTNYRICDEPTPGVLSKFSVNPLWPFLGVMLGGVWLSWPWFLFNAFALGSPTLRKEIAWFALGVGIAAGIVATILYLNSIDIIHSKSQAQYGLLVLTVWKLGATYQLYIMQSRTIELYEYFGGKLRNGLLVLVAAFYFREQILNAIAPNVFASLVLS